jgi:hypothetical protein
VGRPNGRSGSMTQVLVTDATGPVGGEFVRRLLSWDPDAQVTLIVRPKGATSSRARVSGPLGQLFPGTAAHAGIVERVRVVEGDLHADRLGLPDAAYRELGDGVASELGDFAAEVTAMIRQLTPYGFDCPVYDNERLTTALTGTRLAPLPIGSVLKPIVEYPLRTGWGTRPEPRPPLGRPVA